MATRRDRAADAAAGAATDAEVAAARPGLPDEPSAPAERSTPAQQSAREAQDARVKPFPFRFVAPLLWGASLNPINSSIIATSLVAIGLAFGVSAGRTASLIAAVYVASAVAQPTMGKLAGAFGPRRVFLAGLGVLTIGGVVGTMAPSFEWLLVSRVLIGIGTAAGYPTAMSLIRRRADGFGTGIPGVVLGSMSIAAQVTAALGLPLGGVLVGVWDWRAVFAINIPLGVIGIVMTLVWIPKDETGPRGRARDLVSALDPAGLGLFALAVTALIVFLSDLTAPQWWVLAITAGAVAGLIAWELRARHPFIDVRMLAGNGALMRTYARQLLTQSAMYAVLYGYVQWLEEGRGLAASVSGLVMAPMTIVGAIGAALVSRRALVRGPLTASAVAVVAGGVAVAFVSGDTPVVVLIALSLLFGLVTGLNGVSNQAALYDQTSAEQIGVASGLLRTSTYLGAIAASAMIGFAFPQRATDAGLHGIAWIIVGLGIAVLSLVVFDRSIPRRAR